MTRAQILQELERMVKGWNFLSRLELNSDHDRGWNAAQSTCARQVSMLLAKARAEKMEGR